MVPIEEHSFRCRGLRDLVAREDELPELWRPAKKAVATYRFFEIRVERPAFNIWPAANVVDVGGQRAYEEAVARVRWMASANHRALARNLRVPVFEATAREAIEEYI